MANLKDTWYDNKAITEVLDSKVTIIRSRYDNKEQLLLSNGDVVIRNMRFNDIYPGRDSGDTQHKVEGYEAGRPDVIAHNIYGDPRLAWVILSANNLSDFFDLKSGMLITIPSLVSLYRSGGVMNR